MSRKDWQLGFTRLALASTGAGIRASTAEPDPVKSRAAEIFYEKWREPRRRSYLELKGSHGDARGKGGERYRGVRFRGAYPLLRDRQICKARYEGCVLWRGSL